MLDSEPQPNDEQKKSEHDEDPTKTGRPQLGNVSGDYEFKKLDGSVTESNKEVKSFLEDNGITQLKERQGIWRSDIWGELAMFEKHLDQYSAILEKHDVEDKDHFFPNVTNHVNILSEIWMQRKSGYPAERLEPYSDQIISLAFDLDSVSDEWLQILYEEHPSIIKALKKLASDRGMKLTNYHASSYVADGGELNQRLESKGMEKFEFLEGFSRQDFVSECEQGGLLAKHFEELSLDEQRIDRLEIGKELLERMVEEENRIFEENKAKME